jgi:hypothetical protein
VSILRQSEDILSGDISVLIAKARIPPAEEPITLVIGIFL